MNRRIEILFADYDWRSELPKALSSQAGELLNIIHESNLRGRGGAGFHTGKKWAFAAAEPEEERYLICNADEGEPGTFKDKTIIEKRCDTLIAGMLIAAKAIEARAGYIYLRAEYAYLGNAILEHLAAFVEAGLMEPDFIKLRLGAGAYICGEETALIESLESKRGEPRLKPPYPVNQGYLGKPTVVNNVETLALVPHIIQQGAEWFKQIGTQSSSGSKVFSVSGDCAKPGIYEFEFGIKIFELLQEVGAHNTKAVQIGGAGGYCADKNDFDKELCFEGIPTGGSIIIFDESRDMFGVLLNFMEFFRDESCGQCTPCREGCSRIIEGLHKFEEGKGTSRSLIDLQHLCETMRITSRCGLGQSVPNSFITITDKFINDFLGRGRLA